MREGRIEQVAAPDELYRRPATPFVAEFVGTMNRIPGHVEGSRVSVLGRTVAARNAEAGMHCRRVDVLVRPEDLGLEATPHGSAIITTKTFLGSVTRVGVLLDGDTAVRSPSRAISPPGSSRAPPSR